MTTLWGVISIYLFRNLLMEGRSRWTGVEWGWVCDCSQFTLPVRHFLIQVIVYRCAVMNSSYVTCGREYTYSVLYCTYRGDRVQNMHHDAGRDPQVVKSHWEAGEMSRALIYYIRIGWGGWWWTSWTYSSIRFALRMIGFVRGFGICLIVVL